MSSAQLAAILRNPIFLIRSLALLMDVPSCRCLAPLGEPGLINCQQEEVRLLIMLLWIELMIVFS